MSELMAVGQALTPKGVHWVAGQWSKHQEATC